MFGPISGSHRRLATVVCLAGWVLAVPLSSEAAAATATSAENFRYVADPGERNEIVGTADGDFKFADKGAREIRIDDWLTPPACRLVGDREIACRFRNNEDGFLPKDEYVDAGDGDDRLELELAARSGADFNGGCRVLLGPGRDTLLLRAPRSRFANGTSTVGCFATVLAADGEPDVIDCGGTPLGSFRGPRNGGSLKIEADPEDQLVNCSPPLPPEPSLPPGPSCVPIPRGIIPFPGIGRICEGHSPTPGLFGESTQRRGTVLRRGLMVECSLAERGDCLVGASLSRRDARSLGLRVSPRGPRIPVGRARTELPLPGGGRKTLSVKLAASVRRGLARHRRGRPRVLVTALAHNVRGHEARTRISISIGR